MMRQSLTALLISSSLVVTAGDTSWARKPCRCSSGDVAIGTGPIVESVAAMPATQTIPGHTAMPANEVIPPHNAHPVPHPLAPPPGTLGRTYYRATRMIPAYKHPRVGMLDVHIANAENVNVYHTSPFREEDLLDGYNDFRNENLWRFESKPLLPGIPQIYKVVATDSIGQRRVRYVRLIPGRVVDLDFTCDPNCQNRHPVAPQP